MKNVTEAYLEPSQKIVLEIFGENSQQLKVVIYFRKRAASLTFESVLVRLYLLERKLHVKAYSDFS